MANVLIFSLQGNIQRRYLTSLAIPFSRFNYNFTIFYFTFCIFTSFLWNQPKLSFFPQQWHDQIFKYPTRIELASRTTPTISIQFTLSLPLGFGTNLFFPSGSQVCRLQGQAWGAVPEGELYYLSDHHCFTSKDTREHDECKVYLKTLWRSKNLKTLRGGNSTWKKLMDVKIQFNLPFNLPYNIHSNIVKLCPNKTSPVFNVDHDTELLNFYSYIGEVSCCMKMCCHIFAAPAVSTHYVVFDSFFWWKKCASMWCMSALWVGWWTFGSCLVIFGLISFWPTLGIFGERQSSVIPITPSQWALTKSAMGSFLKEKVPFNIGQK